MFKLLLAGVLCLLATCAQAADGLVIGPPGPWVKPASEVPYASRPPPPGASTAYRILLLDQQVRFAADGDEAYQHRIVKIGDATGLSLLGSLSVAWTPTTDTVTVHRLRILRGDQTIDVLARQTFTILRRETNLGQSVLDGVLTANIQPEGLQVGDLVDFAYTTRRREPLLGGRSELAMTAPAGPLLEHVRLTASWVESKPLTWRADDLPKPKLRKVGGITELTLDLNDLKPAEGPKGAPRRYIPRRDIEFSEFRSWAEVSALMAPYYRAASRLRADSPLKAEAAKIRAASSNPKAQVAAALKLVQEQVRYVALVMPDGGLTPVGADVTWERRFGDCKAKSTLLVALLQELGIKAEVAAVNAYGADGLDARLPRIGAFNHVITRAEIAGKVYWLDGTRTGDSDLDAVVAPPFHWALPLREAGAGLERLTAEPLARPSEVVTITVDASGGLHAPGKVHGEMLLGAMGAWMASGMAALPEDKRQELLKGLWSSYSWIDVKTVRLEKGDGRDQRVIMDGTGAPVWVGSGGPMMLYLPNANLSGPTDFERKPGPGADAPFAVNFPSYRTFSFRMVLPEAGEGFTVPAPDVDLKAAGRAFHRRSRIEGGVLTIETSVRALAPEFPAAEAPAATTAIGEMNKVRVFVRAPRAYTPTEADVVALLAKELKTSTEYVDRGGRLAAANRLDAALADFDKAVALAPAQDPNPSDPAAPASRIRAYAYANRGGAYLVKGKVALARADFEKALELDPRNFVALQNLGVVAAREGRYDDAIAAFGRAADLHPQNIFALLQRASAYQMIGEIDRAIRDLDEVLKFAPELAEVHIARFDAFRAAGQSEKALAEITAAVAQEPRNPSYQVYRGALLATLGRSEEAHAAFEASIALRPTAAAYMTRASYRNKTDYAGRLADLDAAKKLAPDATNADVMRANALADAGRFREALAIMDQVVKDFPADKDLRVDRARLQIRAKHEAAAMKEIAALRREAAGEASVLNALCWTQATLNLSLEAALADCEASLRINPERAATIDSHAFVLMRLGRFKDALARYDEAVKRRPHEAESLYGRGVTRLRLGMAAEGAADLAAAKAASSRIEARFAEYGVTP